MTGNESIPLCVDLDGTLVKLDTLHQSLFLLLRRNPASIFRIPGWLAKGKAHFKDQVMQGVSLDATALPYHRQFLGWLHQEREAGRTLVLATASNYRTANAVAEHLGIFDEILASNEETNLRHNNKLDAIRGRFPRFGYAGNDAADFPIWDAAAEVVLVNPSTLAKKHYALKADHIFVEQRPALAMFIKAMRCQQWLKNLLVFSPMLLAHRFTDPGTLLNAALSFLSFSFAASSIYVLNDLFDLSADQHHPRKCKRPFASGDLPIATGALLTPLLVAASLLPCIFFLPPAFLATLLAYYALTTVYSWRLKQVAVADVLMLAVLYSMRIVAGAVATGTVVSGWFIEFAIFLFLSLALVKRLSELREMEQGEELENAHRERGYTVGDLPLLLAFGTASGYIAVFVFTMYLDSEKVAQLYSRPPFLWAFCPLLLYWITRMWHLAWRGKMHDDPLAFAARDPQTHLVGALGIAALLYAI
ncbi:MAG: UbiA family prenyltransferase [Verrucomicrobiota bacterium]|nr:UbiA family prenyltransferase [Verrucomicrobiota bacterium]